MLKGSCGCGRVRYEIDGGLQPPVRNCHCWRCRKHSGASFATNAAVAAETFRLVAGHELLSSWESSPGVLRWFASCCGSPIYKRSEAKPATLGLRMGTLDSDPGVRVEKHIEVDGKAPWVEFCDDLPQERGGAPFGERD
ncbi:MAG: GFA family protein [Halofilum sp. (in: g-proteobacteria)]|nr:GFA family protein [Halofilum sp. (in: g-proteobacteria)]